MVEGLCVYEYRSPKPLLTGQRIFYQLKYPKTILPYWQTTVDGPHEPTAQ